MRKPILGLDGRPEIGPFDGAYELHNVYQTPWITDKDTSDNYWGTDNETILAEWRSKNYKIWNWTLVSWNEYH